MVESAMPRGYGVPGARHRHPTGRPRTPSGVGAVVAAAIVVSLAVTTRSWLVVVAAGTIAAAGWSMGAGCLLAALAAAGVVRADAAWSDLRPHHLGPFAGWATVVAEPDQSNGGARVLLDIDGQRYESWVRGRVHRHRVDGWRAGDRVVVEGVRRSLAAGRQRRVAWQHVVGRLDVEWLGDVRTGSPAANASNRVRALISRGAAALPPDRAALTRGLVIGDDRDEPPAMIERFRDAGLSHLTAVSGQNVALLLAAAGPLLRRARPPTRWAVTLGLIGWFVVLTRAEPSVLRAGMMAATGATAFILGRQAEPLRLLALAVITLLLLDPLLAWSVGFWLSVGATAGVTIGATVLAPRLGRLGPLALPVGITVGAQAGVAIPSVVVFGRLSLSGTVANLLAVPVAGLVMLVGLPACLLAGAMPVLAPVVMAPVGWGVWWVDAVATVAAAVEPPAPWSWFGWLALVATLVWLVGSAPPNHSDERGAMMTRR
jgi:competence protein ComEC